MDVESKVAALADQDISHSKKLASIIGPTRKSIHAIKTPFAMIKHIAMSSRQRYSEEIVQWQAARQTRRQNKLQAQSKPGIKPPRQNIQDKFSTVLSSTGSALKHKAGHFKQGSANVKNKIKQLRPPDQLRKYKKSSAASRISLTESNSSSRSSSPASSNQSAPVSVRLKSASARPESEPAISAVTAKQNKASLRKLFNKESNQPATAIEQAKEALGQDENALVEEILIPYIVKHPHDAQAYMLLGKAACHQQAWEDAVQAFEQVVNLNPKTKNCLAELGRATYQAGHLTKAIEMLQRAHNQNPQDTNVIRDLITIAQRMDNQPMRQSLQEELKELEEN